MAVKRRAARYMLDTNYRCSKDLLDACQRAGIGVPEDVAVVGAENEETLCDFATPPLTSVRFDGHTAGTLVHFMHPIPVGRGFLAAWVTDNVPGWDANGLISAVGNAGLIGPGANCRALPSSSASSGSSWVRCH